MSDFVRRRPILAAILGLFVLATLLFVLRRSLTETDEFLRRPHRPSLLDSPTPI